MSQPTYVVQRNNDKVLLQHLRANREAWERLLRATPAVDYPILARRLRNAGATEVEIADAFPAGGTRNE